MSHDTNDYPSREARVNAAIAEYLRAVDSGHLPDRGTFLKQHADLAPELEAFLADQDRLLQVAFPTPADASLASTGPDLPPSKPPTTPEAGAPTATAAPPGWAGRLQIVEPIGQGGMGAVFRVRDTDFDRDLAVKVLRRELH